MSAAGTEVVAGTEVAAGTAGVSLQTSPRLGFVEQRSVRQGPLAHETLTQLMKHVFEYRPMVSSSIASLLRKFQNEMSFFIRALVSAYTLALEDLPKFLRCHVMPLVRLIVEESCRRVVFSVRNLKERAALLSLFRSLRSCESCMINYPHERMLWYLGTAELTTMLVEMLTGEHGIETLTSYDAAMSSRLRHEIASLRTEPPPNQVFRLTRDEAKIIEEVNCSEWNDLSQRN